MAGLNNRTSRSGNGLPPAAGGSVNGIRLLLAIMFVLIALASVSGVVFAAMTGQPTIAIAIGLVAAAFFCGVVC